MFSLLLITANLLKAEDKPFSCPYKINYFAKQNICKKVPFDQMPGLVTLNPNLWLSVATRVQNFTNLLVMFSGIKT